MPTPTTNLNLLKPSVGESYNVQLLDDNYDKIDTAVGANTTLIKKERHAEYTGPVINAVANAESNAGLMTNDATNSINNTFATPGTTAGIKLLEVGLYYVQFLCFPTTAPSNAAAKIFKGTSDIGVGASDGYGYADFEASGVYNCLTIGDQLDFKFFINTSQNVGTRVRITKMQGA